MVSFFMYSSSGHRVLFLWLLCLLVGGCASSPYALQAKEDVAPGAFPYKVPQIVREKRSVVVDQRPYCWTQIVAVTQPPGQKNQSEHVRQADLMCRNTFPIPISMKIEIKEVHAVTIVTGFEIPSGIHEMDPLQIKRITRLTLQAESWRFRFTSFPFVGKSTETTQFRGHALPFLSGTPFGVSQSPDGLITSHKGVENAIDFSVPVGTPVVSTKDGYVAFVRSGSKEYGRTDAFKGKENIVLIHHDTGEVTVYAHLDADVEVTLGERVLQGQRLGRVGLSGMLGGPHLHFEVQKRKDSAVVVLPVEFQAGTAHFPLRYAGRYVTP